jgi:NADH-quinone oxidoreductase subunit M
VLAAMFLIVAMALLAIPGSANFVGEFLILLGTFQVNAVLAAVATTGIIFAAVYLLWMYQRVIFGEVIHAENRTLTDLTPREWALLAPIIVLIVWIGVYPVAFTGTMDATVGALIAQVQSKASVALR